MLDLTNKPEWFDELLQKIKNLLEIKYPPQNKA